jgi:hypothetical protein
MTKLATIYCARLAYGVVKVVPAFALGAVSTIVAADAFIDTCSATDASSITEMISTRALQAKGRITTENAIRKNRRA